MIKWFRENNDQITWFIIGWLSWGFLDALARGSYTIALIDVILIGVNYMMWKNNGKSD